MGKNASVKRKRGWSDEYIQYGFEIFCDKDAQKSKEQCVICTCYEFLGIVNRLIKTNLSRTLKSGSWKIFKMKMGHVNKKV